MATWLATKFVLILAMLVPFPPQGLFPGRRAERFSVAATPVTRPTASSLTPMATGTSTSRPARMSLWAPASFTGVRMTTTVTLDPSDVSLPVGGDAWITISIHDVADLYGVDVLLEFDPWVVEVLGGAVEPGTMPYPDFVIRNEADSTNGTIWYAVVQFPPHEPASGSGTLARIHVRGLRDGATTLRFTECALSSPAGLDIPSTTGSSLVRVGTGTLVATRTPTVTPTRTPPPSPTPIMVPRWNAQQVDRTMVFEDMGEHSLRLDAAGRPHLAYGSSGLYYAWHDGTAWRRELVDSESEVGEYASLALDADGNPHISYGPNSGFQVKYAHRTGNTWLIETVAWGLGNVESSTSIALDAAGNPHIGYYSSGGLGYAHRTEESWQVETVDPDTCPFGWDASVSLALDAAHNPCLSYSHYQSGEIRYAHWTGSSWRVETIDRVVLGGTSLALDTAGTPHIAYVGSLIEERINLRYARWTGSVWITQTVDASADVSLHPSLALDAADSPRISYGNLTYNPDPSAYDVHGELRYARWTGSAWQAEMIASALIGFTSLALDSAGNPHIGYEAQIGGSYSGSSLNYVHWAAGAWHIETVERLKSLASNSSLALDAVGTPHISYYDFGQGLTHARRAGNTWQIEIVDGPSVSEWRESALTSLVLDAARNPHISYIRGLGFDLVHLVRLADLRYARWTGNAWITETVDSGASLGHFTSLGLDGARNPHIGYTRYQDENQSALCYAHWTGAAWITQTVDSAGDVGSYLSLAVDRVGNPHISYYDGTNGSLKYAHWTGSVWEIEMVDSAGWSRTSLVLDAGGNPHIAYAGYRWALKYASKRGGNWRIETVDNSGGAGASLALDATGAPHISYRCGDGYYSRPRLKYAHKTSQGWLIEYVDNEEPDGATSLRLDAAGNAHMTYCVGYALRYAMGRPQSVAPTLTPTPTLTRSPTPTPTLSPVSVTLDPDHLPLPVGGDAWITISIHDVADLYGVDVLLEFDPWVVEVLGGAVEPGTMPYPDFVVRNEADNANGTIWYAVVQFPPHEPASGSGTLARIHVRGLRDGATTLRFTECALSSPAGLDIPSTTGSSLVRVGTGTLVATRTPKPSVTVTVAPAGKVNLPFVLRGARGR